MLGHVGIGARDQEAEGRLVGQRRPDLLARHEPLVAVAIGPSGERRDVRTGARLGEELAPDLLAGEQRAQEPLLLLLGAVDHDGGRDHPVTNDVATRGGGSPGPGHPAQHVQLLGGARRQPALAHGEVGPREAAVELRAEEGDRIGARGREGADQVVDQSIDFCFARRHVLSFAAIPVPDEY